jgi:hypothetical protein
MLHINKTRFSFSPPNWNLSKYKFPRIKDHKFILFIQIMYFRINQEVKIPEPFLQGPIFTNLMSPFV